MTTEQSTQSWMDGYEAGAKWAMKGYKKLPRHIARTRPYIEGFGEGFTAFRKDGDGVR